MGHVRSFGAIGGQVRRSLRSGQGGDSLGAGAGCTDGGVDAAVLRVLTQDGAGALATPLVDPDVPTTPDLVA
jgi:hypothetical protein